MIFVLLLQETKLPQILIFSVFDPFLYKSLEFLVFIFRNRGRPDKNISIRLEISTITGFLFLKITGNTGTSNPPPDNILYFLIPLFI